MSRLRDRSALLVAIVVPLVLASIFGLIFHNVTGGKVTFAFGVVDQDHGAAAQAFEQHLLGPMERSGLIKIRREPSLAAGRDAADRGKVAATFVLPAGLTAAFDAGRPTQLRVLGSVDATIGAQVADSIAQSYASRVDTLAIAARALRGRPPPLQSASPTSQPRTGNSTPAPSTRPVWPSSSSSSPSSWSCRSAVPCTPTLPSPTPPHSKMTFTRAFIDSMKRWAPLCGLGFVQGWKAAEKSKVYGHERAIGCLTK